jgi:uncharacterized protein YjbI with pentapeptide repeats
LALRHASNATDIARICYQLLRLATAQLPREFLKEKRFRGSLDIVDSSWVGYDGGQYVRDEELSVWQTKPERGQKEETKQSRWGFHGKTVWDFLQLLIVPLMLVAIGLVFSLQQDARQQRVEDQRADAERVLADQRAQDEALQAYLDQMSGLLLEKDLRTSEVNSEVRTLAQVRTLTVLGRLDPSRKTAVMQFLVDADLVQSIDERDPIISLNGADLSGANVSDSDLSFADSANADLSFADLSDANLRGASLSDVELRGAILRHANLSDADLSDAFLRGADLSNAFLRGADLSDSDLRGTDLSDVNPRDLRGTMVDGAADEAILTVRQCSEADASVGPLEERIYEIMPQIPEEIGLGETERAGLLVSPLTIDEVSESDTGCVELADRMKAQLVRYDREQSVISGQHPDIQELSSNRVTRWGWDITARQTGKLELALDLRYAISPEGRQEFRLVPQSPVYAGAIRVTTEQPSP